MARTFTPRCRRPRTRAALPVALLAGALLALAIGAPAAASAKTVTLHLFSRETSSTFVDAQGHLVPPSRPPAVGDTFENTGNAPIKSDRSSKARTEADTSSARHHHTGGSQSAFEPDLGSAFDPTRTVARAGTKDSTPGALYHEGSRPQATGPYECKGDHAIVGDSCAGLVPSVRSDRGRKAGSDAAFAQATGRWRHGPSASGDYRIWSAGRRRRTRPLGARRSSGCHSPRALRIPLARSVIPLARR